MSHIDVLEALGLARSALDGVITKVTGAGVKQLLRKHDSITWAMNRVIDERLRIAALDTSDAVHEIDALTADLEKLAAKTAAVAKAASIATKILAVVDTVVPAAPNFLAAGFGNVLGAHAVLPGAAAAAGSHAMVGTLDRTFTAVCDVHGEIPQPRVTLLEAEQNKDSHESKPANASCTVDIIVVK